MRIRFPATKTALAALVAEGFLSRLSFGFISFALPLYAFRRGMSLTSIGILISFNMILAIPLKPVMAGLADRFGLKRTLIAAISLRSAVPLLLIFSPSPWQLFVIRGLHGVSIALRDPSVNALIAEAGGKKAVASAFAWYQTGKSVAGTFGKALAGILLGLPAAGFPFVFGAAFFLSMLPLLAMYRVPADDRQPADQTVLARKTVVASAPAAPRARRRRRRKRRSVVPYAVLGLLISGTAYMMTNLFPILATEYAGLSDAQTGFVYILSIAVILTGPLWGWLSDHVSRDLVLAVRGSANVVSSFLYLVAPNLFGMAAGRVTDDLGKAAFRPAWGAVMAELALVDRRRRARVMGSLTVGEDIGETLAPVAAGLLWSAWGVAVVLVARIALAAITEVYTYTLTRRPGRRETAATKRVTASSLAHSAAGFVRRTAAARRVAIIFVALLVSILGFMGRESIPREFESATLSNESLVTFTSRTQAWEITHPARFMQGIIPRPPQSSPISLDGIWIATFDSPRFDVRTGGPLLHRFPGNGVTVLVYQTFGGPFLHPEVADSSFPIRFEDLKVVSGNYAGEWRSDSVVANGEPYTFHVRIGPQASQKDREAAAKAVSSFRLLPLEKGTVTGQHVVFYVLGSPDAYPVGSVTRFDASNLPTGYGKPYPFHLVHVPAGFYALVEVNGEGKYRACGVTYNRAVGEFSCPNGARWGVDGSVTGRPDSGLPTHPLQVALVRISLDGHVIVSPNTFISDTQLDLFVT